MGWRKGIKQFTSNDIMSNGVQGTYPKAFNVQQCTSESQLHFKMH